MTKLKNLLPIILLLIAISIIGPSCGEDNTSGLADADPLDTCVSAGVSYVLDGQLVSYDNSTVYAEIHPDVVGSVIGKNYDIYTDGMTFHFHSSITETGETGPYSFDWAAISDTANITFLNNMTNVDVTFTVEFGASAVGGVVRITFSGTYSDAISDHTITNGEICTIIDAIK